MIIIVIAEILSKKIVIAEMPARVDIYILLNETHQKKYTHQKNILLNEMESDKLFANFVLARCSEVN